MKIFLGTGKIFKIPNQFLEIRDLLYTKLLQAGKKTFIKKKKQSHLITKCFATNWISPVSKLQLKKDFLHPYTYLDWWERYVCNDFSFKQIVCPISNLDVREYNQSFRKTSRGGPSFLVCPAAEAQAFVVMSFSLCGYVFAFVCFCLWFCVFVSLSLCQCLCHCLFVFEVVSS